ncbi:MAG: PCC domain-containing protein [Thermoleophilia bacterium]
MKYTEGTIGRVFILRLEDGEVLNDTIEAFARDRGVGHASVTFLGGSADGSTVVVGPDAGRSEAIVPLTHTLQGHREVLALGTLAPDEKGEPVLHMHAAAGREGDATVGCTRAGVNVWLVGEVVIQEILGAGAERVHDPATGFALLEMKEVEPRGAARASGPAPEPERGVDSSSGRAAAEAADAAAADAAESTAGSAAQTIPARRGRAVRLKTGQSVRVINTHGHQVVDTWAFSLSDLTESMSMEHTRAALRSLFVSVGQSLVTNRRRPILTLTEDTSPGGHDTLIAACDRYRYEQLGCAGYHDNCTDNLAHALAQLGHTGLETPSPWNLFMHIPVGEDGHLEFQPPRSKPGDSATLRAEQDCIVVFSACPQDVSSIPVNADAPTEAHFVVLL